MRIVSFPLWIAVLGCSLCIGVGADAQELASLPDAPQPQNRTQPEDSKTSDSGKLPAILAPEITREPQTAQQKFALYVHQAFNPVALVPPAFSAAFEMANPPDHYPREWKNGAGAYGRLYGDYLTRDEAQKLAQMLTTIALPEDSRYSPSISHNVFGRIAHAVGYTLVDRSDSGHSMPAISNFAGAAASGFVGSAYLPSGTYIRPNRDSKLPGTVVPYQYDDAVHAGQRSATALAGLAGGYIANEFCPEWGPLVEKLHIPFLHPPCEERIEAKRP